MTQQNNHNLNNHHQFLILPSQRLLKYQSSNHKLSLLLNVKAQDYASAKNKLALISGKAVKYYNIENGFSSTSVPILQSYFPKKVQGVTLDTEGKIVVTDKFGDIYQARTQNSLYLNSNLGIPTFMKHIHNSKSKKQFIVLGDDYCKFKVYNYKNMHQISSIWYIPNAVPLDILQVNNQTAILLVKHEDKQNLKHTYKLYEFNINDLEESDFKGSLVYADKVQTLNNSQYHPCSMSYDEESKTLFFLKLYDNQLQVLSFKCEQNNKITLLKQIQMKLPYPVVDGNSVQGFSINEGENSYLLVSYGKYYNIDNQNEQNHQNVQKQVNWNEFEKSNDNNSSVYKVTQNEYLLKLKLN